jgi:hypothetical protein
LFNLRYELKFLLLLLEKIQLFQNTMVFELRSIWSLGPDVAQNEKMTVLARTRSKFAQSSKATGSAIVRIFENNEILEIQLYSSKYTHPSTVVSLLGVYGFICFYLTCHSQYIILGSHIVLCFECFNL